MGGAVSAGCLTAVMVGLGCGSCCSPVISVFLSSYVISHGEGMKSGFRFFVSFFLGKIISTTSLCIAAAIVGRQFLGEDGYIGAFNLRLGVRLMMSAIGLWMAVRWIWEQAHFRQEQQGCESCHGCGQNSCTGRPEEESNLRGKKGIIPALLAGLAYGMTPCGPLLMMLAYTFTLPPLGAGLVGCVFGLSSAASPILLIALLSGVLSRKMAAEIPGSMKWFRLASYLLLAVMPFAV